MAYDHSLIINSKKSTNRYLQSDNVLTYLTISDFKNSDDGLWSHGFQIFNAVIPGRTISSIKNKIFHPASLDILYEKMDYVNFILFKNGNGLLIELKTKKIIEYNERGYLINYLINSPYEIIEKNIKNIILEFNTPQKEYYGFPKLYCAVAVGVEHDMINIRQENNYLRFFICDTKRTNRNLYFYILYHPDYDQLKKILENNITQLDKLKKDHFNSINSFLTEINFHTNDVTANKAINWALLSSLTFIMNNDIAKGIWAGFPWFDQNWGRDTFISLPGICLVQGRYKEAREIILGFASFQNNIESSKDYGRIPNIIYNTENVKYNSSDATPLFIREVYEYYLYTGDTELIVALWANIQHAVDHVYFAHKDSNYFIANNDSEDWMDAQIEGKYAYSPRGGYAVELQALWYIALYFAGIIALEILKNMNDELLPAEINRDQLSKKAQYYKNEAILLKKSFNHYFITDSPPFIHDGLSRELIPFQQIRPNSLLAFYYSNLRGVPRLVNRQIGIKLLKYLLSHLIYPHGIASLSKEDLNFHPIHISKNYHKDAAYHNGCIWLWLSGIFTHLSCFYGLENFAAKQTYNLFKLLIEGDTPGMLSELVDPLLKNQEIIVTTGAYSQAWSIGELCRAVFQDYIGIHMNVNRRKLYISPAVPLKFNTIRTNIKFGTEEILTLFIKISQANKKVKIFEIKGMIILKPITVIIKIYHGTEKFEQYYLYKYIEFKIKIYKANGLFRGIFESLNTDMIKTKAIEIEGLCEVISIKTKKYKYEAPISEGLHYTDLISLDYIKVMNTIINKDYLLNKIKKKKD